MVRVVISSLEWRLGLGLGLGIPVRVKEHTAIGWDVMESKLSRAWHMKMIMVSAGVGARTFVSARVRVVIKTIIDLGLGKLTLPSFGAA